MNMLKSPELPSPPPPDGFPQPTSTSPRSRRRLVLGIVGGVVVVLVIAVIGLGFLYLRYEGQQVALVEDVLSTVAAGEPIPADKVCADPDDVVRGLVETPRSWPIDSYTVMGISPLTPYSPTSLWYVEAMVDGEKWIVEVWDSGAGRMAGVCAFTRHPDR